MSTTTTTTANGTGPKITLYTSHHCPYAHRAHITLSELSVPYEEVLIDLDSPRPDWYLQINPRGLVPSIRIQHGTMDEIITESAIVAQFLADSFPSTLLPASDASPTAPLERAQIAFFADTYTNKLPLYTLMRAPAAEKESKARELVEVARTHIEPLLALPPGTSGPFFRGSERITMAEVLTAPFVLRFHAYSRHGFVWEGLDGELLKLPNYGRWARAVMSNQSVVGVWNEQGLMAYTRERMAKMVKAQREKEESERVAAAKNVKVNGT
jgi:glutathione S-transferase